MIESEPSIIGESKIPFEEDLIDYADLSRLNNNDHCELNISGTNFPNFSAFRVYFKR